MKEDAEIRAGGKGRRSFLGVVLSGWLGSLATRAGAQDRGDGVNNVKRWGAKGDGVTDDSEALQAAIDACKGRELLIPPGRFLHAGVSLVGSSYDGTTIRCQGELVLKPRPGNGAANFQSNWAGLILKDVNRVTVHYRGDGNRGAQPTDEHCHLVCIAGGSRYNFPVFSAQEVRGDGIYIGQSIYGRDSAPPTDLKFGQFSVVNSDDDGRNAMTIISAKGLSIDAFRSVKVGAAPGGTRQPGGFCIEPNASHQGVSDIKIRTLHAEGAGGTMMQISGSADNYTTNVRIGVCTVINTSRPNTKSPVTGELVANQYRVANILRARNVTIDSFVGTFTNAYGDGMAIAESDNVQLPNVTLRHVRLGAVLGQSSVSSLRNSSINVTVYESIQGAIQTGNLENTKISGRVLPAVDGYYANKFAVWAMRSGGQQNNVDYDVQVDNSPSWTRAYRNDASFPVRLKGCRVRAPNAASLGARAASMQADKSFACTE